jgi:plastocyanin
MTDVHPHWRTTQEEIPSSQSAAAADAPRAQEAVLTMPKGAMTVSRKPAAIVGILLVIAVGYMFVQGMSGLVGQLTGSTAVVIRITAQGFDPASVTVRPGQTITWKNEDAIPHIVFSDSLKNDKNGALLTSPIFRGSEASVTLKADLPTAEYEYASRTKADWKGKIVIELPAVSSSSSSEAPASSAPSVPAQTVPQASSISSTSSSDSKLMAPVPGLPDTTAAAGGIPENPFTVASPVTASTLPAQTGTTPKPPLMQQTVSKPIAQPESGPGFTWVIGIVSAGALLLLSRKAFRA